LKFFDVILGFALFFVFLKLILYLLYLDGYRLYFFSFDWTGDFFVLPACPTRVFLDYHLFFCWLND